MKIIKEVHQGEVLAHWVNVEGLGVISARKDIVDPLLVKPDLKWYLALIDERDLDHIYNISSDDWRKDGLSVPDFKVVSAVSNIDAALGGKHKNIAAKEELLKSEPGILDTKLFGVSVTLSGPYTLIEGNKRAVALCRLNQLAGTEVYLGLSTKIRQYVWARNSY